LVITLVSGVAGVAMRTVLVVGLCCVGAALAAGCGIGSTASPTATKTVTVAASAEPRATESTAPATSTRPRTKVFDEVAVAGSVKKILTDDYKVAGVTDVTCPATQKVRDGNTFDCTVIVAGKTKKVTITVIGSDGNYQVGSLK
jgi:hypothetical protein